MQLYKQKKTKTSQDLPLDKKSILQAIKCIYYKVYYWPRIDEAIINDILLQGHGLIVDNEIEEVRLLWFTGMFLISCLKFHSNQQI